MNQIDIQIKRCKRITHNLLRFSRRTQSVIDTVDINAYIREIVELVEREAKSSGITFFERLSPEVPPILSDPSQLQQVFLNLISNAIDAHAEKQYGSVAVSSTYMESEGAVEIVVSDTGCGIPARESVQGLRSFFYHQGRGQRDGAGAFHLLQHHQAPGGEDPGQERTGPGNRFYDPAAAAVA